MCMNLRGADKNMHKKNKNFEKNHKGRNFLKFLPGIIFCCFMMVIFAGGAFSRNINTNNPKEVYYERQESKVRNGIYDYQNAAELYMKEKEGKSVKGLTANNCENIGKYFKNMKIKCQEGCNITTENGTYWQFNKDGSAKISNSKKNPIFQVDVGVCDDGTVNCDNKYPYVSGYIHSR